jgi:hypothetical protein
VAAKSELQGHSNNLVAARPESNGKNCVIPEQITEIAKPSEVIDKFNNRY